MYLPYAQTVASLPWVKTTILGRFEFSLGRAAVFRAISFMSSTCNKKDFSFITKIYINRYEKLFRKHLFHDLVPFLQFKKREKHPWRSVTKSWLAVFHVFWIAEMVPNRATYQILMLRYLSHWRMCKKSYQINIIQNS